MAERGFIFTATGDRYRQLTKKAVASLRAHHPNAEIDIYTDAALDVPGASQVHLLPDTANALRPRFYALRDTRFDLVISLDADIRVVAPIDDVFEVVERFDIVMAHDQLRNAPFARMMLDDQIPNAFPQFNAGVLGLRRSDKSAELLDLWEDGYMRTKTGKDQPALREILWRRPDIRCAVLPPEYNQWDYWAVDRMRLHQNTAPRLLHNRRFAEPKMVAKGPDDLGAILGRSRLTWLNVLLSGDHTLSNLTGRPAEPGQWRRRYLLALVQDAPKMIAARLRRVVQLLLGRG